MRSPGHRRTKTPSPSPDFFQPSFFPSINLVLFDLDGTLYDGAHNFYGAAKKMLEEAAKKRKGSLLFIRNIGLKLILPLLKLKDSDNT